MPTLELQPGAAGLDTRIYQSIPDNNYGASALIILSASDPGLSRGLVAFDISSLPADAVISSAILTLYHYTASTADISAHRALTQWYEGDADGGAPSGDGSTWNHRNYSGSVAWAGGAGGGSGSDYAAVATDTVTMPVTDFFDLDVTADVTDFYAGTYPNYGWWLITPELTSRNIASSDDGTAARHPKLTITYELVAEIDNVQDTVNLSDTVIIQNVLPAGVGLDTVTVGESIVLLIPNVYTASQDTISLADQTNAELISHAAVQDAVGVDEVHNLESAYATGVADTISVTEYVDGYTVRAFNRPQNYARPLLYLTDGTYAGGRLNKFDLLSRHAGYLLCDWEPTIAQQKGGGVYNESSLVSGRRLISYVYENPIETFVLSANAHDQNTLARYTRELIRWLETAAEFWTSRFATKPIYLVARSAYETNTRYAVVHNGSIPKLKNLYGNQFFNQRNSFFDTVEVYVERGHWLDQPPDQSSCAALSTEFTWNWSQTQLVVSGVTGTINALIECIDGTLLAGSSDAAKVFASVDDGLTWTLVDTIGAGADAVNAFTKDGSGNIYAAVSGSTAAGGVWRSVDCGANWTRMTGGITTDVYNRAVSDWQVYDVIFAPLTGYVHAVGDVLYDVAGVRAAGFLDSQDGTTWQGILSSWYYYRGVGIALERGLWPNVLLNYSLVSPNANAWIYYHATDHVTQGFLGTFLGPYAYGGYDLVGWDSGLPQPTPFNLLAAIKTPSAGTHTAFYKLMLGAGYSYSPISQIDNEVIYTIYVDPAFNITPALRLYAGGDGDIYLSENGGYSWSLLTNSPTGEVHSFLRTSTGALIAGGEDGIILVETEQNIVPTQATLGQDAVCTTPGVYVGNQRFQSNLTNVIQYDASLTAYTELYPMAILPVELFPAVPAAGDILYFGAQSNIADLDIGPFNSLVFDLDQDQLGRDLTIVWEYWSGAAWTTLLTEDRTVQFTASDVKSVSWQILAANWATTSVQSITGWWVRARITAVGTNPQSPRQLNSNVYTVNNNCVDIPATEIAGDIPALSQLLWRNVGDKDNGSTAPYGYIDRLLVGLRSYDRGAVFNSIINLSDEQVPFGFTLTDDAYSSWVAQGLAPMGRCLKATLVIASPTDPTDEWVDLVTVDVDNTIAEAYYGTFRVLARCYKPAGVSTDWRLRLAVRFGSGGSIIYSKNYPYVSTTSAWHVADFGSITIPSEQSVIENVGDTLQFIIQGWGDNAGIDLYLFDLVLIPVDEWSVDVLRSSYDAAETEMRVGTDDYLDINSLLVKSSSVVGTNRDAGGLIKAYYQVVTNGKGILQVGARQRLWFFAMTQTGNATWVSFPHALGQVQVNKVQQYKALRGAE